MSEDELIDAVELGKRLGISRSRVFVWLGEGRITPAVREGKTLRFDYLAVRKELARRAKKRVPKHKTPLDALMVPVL